MKRTIGRLMATGIVLALVVGLFWIQPAAAKDRSEIIIGTNLPMTGILAGAGREQKWSYEQAVADIMPRIVDVLNGYLRAVATEDLERPTALVRLRAQMLRRIRLIADKREIRDLLVAEFVLN